MGGIRRNWVDSIDTRGGHLLGNFGRMNPQISFGAIEECNYCERLWTVGAWHIDAKVLIYMCDKCKLMFPRSHFSQNISEWIFLTPEELDCLEVLEK